MVQRTALLIGNSQYDDPSLKQLASPHNNVKDLAKLLSNQPRDSYTVTTVIDGDMAQVLRATDQFFKAAGSEDMLVFYFSGHGLRDMSGDLHFAVRDTLITDEKGEIDPNYPIGSVRARDVRNRIESCRSKRIIILLDCCHSGAFLHGTMDANSHQIDSPAGVKEAFEGMSIPNGIGRIILTASDALQYSFDGLSRFGEYRNSLFTHFLIEGITHDDLGDPRDGSISIDALFDYVQEQMRAARVLQTPQKWVYPSRLQGRLIFAYVSRGTKVMSTTEKLTKDVKDIISKGKEPDLSPEVRLDINLKQNILLYSWLLHQQRGTIELAALKKLVGADNRVDLLINADLSDFVQRPGRAALFINLRSEAVTAIGTAFNDNYYRILQDLEGFSQFTGSQLLMYLNCLELHPNLSQDIVDTILGAIFPNVRIRIVRPSYPNIYWVRPANILLMIAPANTAIDQALLNEYLLGLSAVRLYLWKNRGQTEYMPALLMATSMIDFSLISFIGDNFPDTYHMWSLSTVSFFNQLMMKLSDDQRAEAGDCLAEIFKGQSVLMSATRAVNNLLDWFKTSKQP